MKRSCYYLVVAETRSANAKRADLHTEIKKVSDIALNLSLKTASYRVTVIERDDLLKNTAVAGIVQVDPMDDPGYCDPEFITVDERIDSVYLLFIGFDEYGHGMADGIDKALRGFGVSPFVSSQVFISEK